MLETLAAIPWNIPPGFEIGPITIRWYGMLFALPFILGYHLLQPIFRDAGKKASDLESLTLYMIVATVVGARLGHCLFYEPLRYLSDPIAILKVWEGGLASHGAALGILAGMYLFARKKAGFDFLWIADRVVIVVALAGFFIRMGNLMNSEIFGVETDLPWGFIFLQKGYTVPHHPTQIYEALCYLAIFFVLWLTVKNKGNATPHGLPFGILLTGIFTARFLIEFLKLPQENWEQGMALNMGQILSIPLIAAGILMLLRSRRDSPNTPRPTTSL